MKNKNIIREYLSGHKEYGHRGNIFYEIDRIYSYGHHYLLGEKSKKVDPNVLFVNSKRYSVTTSMHASAVNSYASQKGFRVYSINNLTKLRLATLNNRIYEDEMASLVASWVHVVTCHVARNGKRLKKQGLIRLSELKLNIEGTMVYLYNHICLPNALELIVKTIDEILKSENTSDKVYLLVWDYLLSSIEELKHYKKLQSDLTGVGISYFDYKEWAKLAVNISSDDETLFHVHEGHTSNFQNEDLTSKFYNALSINKDLFTCVDENRKVQVFSSIGIGELVAQSALAKVSSILKDYYTGYDTENLNV